MRLLFNKVSICAFSGYADFPRRFDRAVEELKQICNYVCIDGIRDDSVKGRLECFYKALEDPNIDAIISLTGGYNSNELLSELDYNYVSNNYKPIIGYSDTTAILLAIYAICGLPSFYGPAVLSDFGAFGGIHKFTLDSLIQALTAQGPYQIQQPNEISYSNDFWDKDDIILPRFERNLCEITHNMWKNRVAEGALIGGNLNTLLALLGTKFFPNLENSILFLEDCNIAPEKLRRDLNSLEQAGVFQMVNGILFSKFFEGNMSADRQKVFCGVIERFFYDYPKPIMYQLDFGHHTPRYTIPIGAYARIDTGRSIINILKPMLTK